MKMINCQLQAKPQSMVISITHSPRHMLTLDVDRDIPNSKLAIF